MPRATPLRPSARSLAPRRRASAMIETVLVLPVVILILLLLLFFGRANVRVQHADMTARYDAWRRAARAPGPEGRLALNRTFFAGNANVLDRTANRWFPPEPGEQLVTAAPTQATSELVERALQALPRGRQVKITVRHEDRLALFDRLNRPILRSHTRLDGDWPFVRAWRDAGGTWRSSGPRTQLAPAVHETFWPNFDQRLAGASGSDAAQMIRGLYRGAPGYRGPEVNFGP